MKHPLIGAWTEFEAADAPFVLPGDEALLKDKERPGFVVYRSLAEYASSAAFGSANDRRLHLGLRPIPFAGPVDDARVYLLMLNPGLSPGDYFAEWHHSSYAAAAAQNLKGARPFLFLDPEFAWHPGFAYWHGKLAAVIRALSTSTGLGHAEVLRRVARKICLLQLLPYHSPTFGVSRQVLQRLWSCQLVKDFVAEVLVPRARAGGALIVVARHAAFWNVPSDCKPVVYAGAATRAAHLTPKSDGGARILKVLLAQIEDTV